MSTTFDIYPQVKRIPKFKKIHELTMNRLNSIWQLHNLNEKIPELNFELINLKTNERSKVDMNQPARWDDNYYLWISFNGIGGGTDGYFHRVDEMMMKIWEEEENNAHIDYYQRANDIRKSLDIGHYWTFRRSAGQPSIIVFTYGLVASAIAELTKGYIWSDDGAWDFKRFPALYKEFDHWYLNEELALDKDNKEWAKLIIESLKKKV